MPTEFTELTEGTDQKGRPTEFTELTESTDQERMGKTAKLSDETGRTVRFKASSFRGIQCIPWASLLHPEAQPDRLSLSQKSHHCTEPANPSAPFRAFRRPLSPSRGPGQTTAFRPSR